MQSPEVDMSFINNEVTSINNANANALGSSKLHKVTVESILYKPGSLLGWIGGCEGDV